MKRALLIFALLGSASAMADNSAVINHSGQQYDGVLSINQAAGTGQQMSNSRAIALGGQAIGALLLGGGLDVCRRHARADQCGRQQHQQGFLHGEAPSCNPAILAEDIPSALSSIGRNR